MSGLGIAVPDMTEQAITGNTLAQRRRDVRLAATSDALPL
jgi:hypothetical protein